MHGSATLRRQLLVFSFALRGSRGISARCFPSRLLIRDAAADGGLLFLPPATDLNALRLWQCGLGNSDRQHAILELALDLIFINALRQLECANERAVGALHHLIAIVLA